MQILLRKDASKWVYSFIGYLTREDKYSDITEAIEKDLDELQFTGEDKHSGKISDDTLHVHAQGMY